MKKRSIGNDPVGANSRDRGLVVPIRIFMNAAGTTPSPANAASATR